MTRGKEEKGMCVCKRSRTVRSSIRIGWDHMVSEAITERFVFRVGGVLLCPSKWSKMHLCLIKDTWVCNKGHTSHEPCVRRHRFCMTTKSPTLNISVFVTSSVGGFEKTGPTRLSCVFVEVFRCTDTLTCIIRGLHLHAHLQIHVNIPQFIL